MFSNFRLAKLTAELLWRNLECAYLARVANRRGDYIHCLMNCVGYEFISRELEISGIACHTQARPGYSVRENGERTSEICWEAPVCITVFRNSKPLVGMAVEFRGPILCIRQLQGVPGAKIPETLRKWPAHFVDGAKNFLYNTDEIVALRLYTADQRPSYEHPVGEFTVKELENYRRNLRRRYDGTARQQGLKKKGPKFWEWDLSLLPK